MLTFILKIIHYGILLIFGVFVSAAFLGINFNKKNFVILSLVSVLIIVIQLTSYSLIGFHNTEAIYPIIAHLPLVLFFALYYKFGFLSAIISVMSAYLCCQLGKWLGLFVQSSIVSDWLSISINIFANIIIGLLLIRYTAPQIKEIFSKSAKSLLALSVLPITYYTFDYTTSVYTNILYQGYDAVIEFLPFMLCVAYIIFITVYFKEYEEKCQAENYNQMMKIKQSQSEKEIDAIKRSEYAVSILRHDLRHFLNNISTCIEDGDNKKALNYINEIIKITDKTALKKYSSNKIINMIISSYESQIKENNICFDFSMEVPSNLEISDVDMTSLLSNSIENAIHAVCKLDNERRWIFLKMHMKGQKLLISLQNPYSGVVDMIDGLPQAKESGHGLGTQSIQHAVKRLNGNCQFKAVDGIFTLQVIV